MIANKEGIKKLFDNKSKMNEGQPCKKKWKQIINLSKLFVYDFIIDECVQRWNVKCLDVETGKREAEIVCKIKNHNYT